MLQLTTVASSKQMLRRAWRWRRLGSMCLVIYVAGLAWSGRAQQQSPAQSQTGFTASVWEGEIQDPKRPIVVHLDFPHSFAQFDTSGSKSWPLKVSDTNDKKTRFTALAGKFPFNFHGQQAGNEISGTVDFAGHQLPFTVQRLPELPKPQTRVEAWQEDISVLNSRFLRYDRSFSPSEKIAFKSSLRNLAAEASDLSDQAIMVRMASTLAFAHNGHTRLNLMRNRTEVRQLPLRVWWFRDGLYVIRADPSNRTLLGCRILKIGDETAEEALEKVRGIDAGSATWKLYMSSYFLTSPDILYGAAVLSSSASEPLTLSCEGRKKRTAIQAPALVKSTEPQEVWHDLAPSFQDGDMSAALPATAAPLYLQNFAKNYWFRYLPQNRVLYLQYNRAQVNPAGPSPTQFQNEVERAIQDNHPRALVFDLRFNTGGDGFMAEPLIRMIATHTPAMRVFVITGRATFSAGIMATAELREWAQATIVGEPVGDGLQFWAEGGNLVLPNSGLSAHYANGFHDYAKNSTSKVEPFVRLEVDSLRPQIPAQPTWAEYMAGADVPLNEILKILDSKH